MADDGLSLVLSRLDEPVSARPAFAAALRAALHAELGFAPAAAGAMPDQAVLAPVAAPVAIALGRRPLLERLTGSLRPMTPRLALLMAVTLLLIACTVAGAWVVVRGWLSSGPGGIQYTNDFGLSEVYRMPGAGLTALQAGPDGASLYAVRSGFPDAPPTEAAVVSFTPGEDGTLRATDVVALDSLRDPALWPAGTDPSAGEVVPGPRGFGGGEPLAVAPDGSLFLALGLSTDPQGVSAVTTLVVVRPDGSVAPVLSMDELYGDGLFDRPAGARWGWINVAASAPDLLWGLAEAQTTTGGSLWLLEVEDPTADGDWTDRIARRLVLPDDVPVFTDSYEWSYGGFTAEPSTPGHDRRSSALLQVYSRSGEYRLYRVSDPDRDGDATGPGETELVFTGTMTGPDGVMTAPLVAPRVVERADPPIDEVVIAGLTRMTRISRITDAGVVDIVRAVPSVFGLAATRDGSIYLASWEAGEGENQLPGSIVVHRLTPVPVGAPVPTDAPTPGAAEPGPTASSAGGIDAPSAAPTLLERHPLTDGVPRIAAWYGGTTETGDWASELVFMGVDGSGPADLLPPGRAEGLCPAVDGSRVAFWSDDEVPNESYLYVDDVGGANRVLVTESANMISCPFPVEAIAYLRTSADPWRLTWHPFAGEERELLSDVAVDGFLDVTRDGRHLALVTGTGGRGVTVVDVAGGEADVLVDGMPDRVRRAAWSPDGTRLAVATGPWDPMEPEAHGRFEVWIVDGAGAAPVRLTEVEGRPPTLRWSTDGGSIAILARNGAEAGMDYEGRLHVVDVESGRSRAVVPDAVFAGWSPVDPGTFAYATSSTLFIETDGAPAREIPGPTGKLCEVCSERPIPRWPAFGLGWSPDGRYLGTGDSIVGVVDVETGEYRVLLTDGEESLVYGARWWP